MAATEAGDLLVDENTVSRHFLGDGGGIEVKTRRMPSCFLGFEGGVLLAGEEGLPGPGGAPEEAGGVGGGGHRVDFLVPLGDLDILGFVALEEEGGGGADDVGGGGAGEEVRSREPPTL